MLFFLRLVAQRDRRDDRDPGLAARDAGRDAAGELHARHRLAAGDDADHRHPRRRLDRRPGERRAPFPPRRGTRATAAISGRIGDRRRRDRHHARRRRRLLADLVPAGFGRAVLARVRSRRHRRDADVAVRLVHGDAVAGRPLGAALDAGGRGRRSSASATASSGCARRYVDRVLRWALRSAACWSSSISGALAGRSRWR